MACDGRQIAISSSAVGVSVDFIEKRATNPAVQAAAQKIKHEMGDANLIISVGRTDYTKGGMAPLESFERVLETNPDLRGKVRLMHVSVSANRNMMAYEDTQAALEEAAGRINGRFGTLEWQPIALISRAIPFDDLIKYYLAADVAWITPLADGMNLVCKEYVATRTDNDGVLVLSEFAGAAVEMGAAVITKPFSYRSMDRAILQALHMPADERRARMMALRDVVKRYSVAAWGRDQDRAFAEAVARRHDGGVQMVQIAT
ncbi:trehalose-6-phosphate synthase [Yoonia sp.]|uniref:alpha,alpha-trehalose-phosphate synthase (UDP-forming) n=1 Tax=Yoonia sp. TaxID=2212373 RepID=UPI00345C1021